jgi:hypothetical protein
VFHFISFQTDQEQQPGCKAGGRVCVVLMGIGKSVHAAPLAALYGHVGRRAARTSAERQLLQMPGSSAAVSQW